MNLDYNGNLSVNNNLTVGGSAIICNFSGSHTYIFDGAAGDSLIYCSNNTYAPGSCYSGLSSSQYVIVSPSTINISLNDNLTLNSSGSASYFQFKGSSSSGANHQIGIAGANLYFRQGGNAGNFKFQNSSTTDICIINGSKW